MKFLFVILTILACASCAKNDSATTTEIEGSWSEACGTGDDHVSGVFVGKTATYVSHTHEAGNCANERFVAQQKFTFELTAATREIKNLDGKQVAFTVTPKSDAGAAELNSQTACGFTDWQKDIEKNVAGLICNGTPISVSGQGYFTIYQLDTTASPQTLTLGRLTATLDATTAAKRPTSLGRTMIKQ